MTSNREGVEEAAENLRKAAESLGADAALADKRAMEAQQRATKARNLLERLRVLTFSGEGDVRERAATEAAFWRREEEEVRRQKVEPALARSQEFRASLSAQRLMDADEQVIGRLQVQEALRRAGSAPNEVTRQVDRIEERLQAVVQRSEQSYERVREWVAGLSEWAEED
jgi:hypothetical protein